MEKNSKEHASCWIQFQDKASMNQWVTANEAIPEPFMVISKIDWDGLRVYFETHTIYNPL